MSIKKKESWIEPYELAKLPDVYRIGYILRQARMKAELRQEDVADFAGLPLPQVRSYENGYAKCPPLYARISLAKCLHISIFDLLMDDEQGLRDLVIEKESKNNGKY